MSAIPPPHNRRRALPTPFSLARLRRQLQNDAVVALRRLQLSQYDVARCCGLSQSYIHHLLHGEGDVAIDRLLEILYRLDIEVDVRIRVKDVGLLGMSVSAPDNDDEP